MRIALLQLNPTVGDLKANADALLRAAERARDEGASLAIASELVTTGYPPRDLVEREAFLSEVERENARIVAEIPDGLTLVFGTLEKTTLAEGRLLHNAALVAKRGSVLARAHKQLLPSYDVFDEDRYFEPGKAEASVNIGGRKLALSICEDAWNDVVSPLSEAGAPSLSAASRTRRYHQNPLAHVASSKPDLLVNLSASPFTLSKMHARPAMYAEIARTHGVALAFVNQVGGNDELVFDGRSTLFGAEGQVLARANAFAEDIVIADLDAGGPVAEDVASEEEAAYEALVLGVRDYVRKCGFSRVVLGLSGGIDSALVAAIATDALGEGQVLGVAMPSRYSSEGSKRDARALAENLGIEYREVSIEPIFESYELHLTPTLAALGEPREGDVTFENVQARIRCAILMAISNRTGAMVLTTGNKSEIAVGYTTLYGDMAGGLAVISDVPKTMVYRISRFINRSGERIPHSTIVKPPSAELRENQLDQDSLPPYELLDRILELYIEDGLSRDAIVEEALAPDIVDRVILLVHASEYKRRQAAPGLFLTKKAFGIGRRMPIAQRFRG